MKSSNMEETYLELVLKNLADNNFSKESIDALDRAVSNTHKLILDYLEQIEELEEQDLNEIEA